MDFTASDGHRVHYDLVDGPPGAPAVVWAHGFLLSSAFYADVTAHLPGYRHLVPDLRAHGRTGSRKTATTGSDATLARMADDLWEMTVSAGVGSFAVVGHSMGNAVVTRLAAAHPRAVLAGVSVAGIPVTGKLPPAREELAGLVELAGDRAAFATMLGALHVHHSVADDPVERAADAAAVVGQDAIRQIVTEEFFRDDSADLLPELSQPWLFVVPGADSAEPPDHQISQAKLLTDSRHVLVEGEGHMVPQERPELVAEAIDVFLDNALPHPA